jgi:hypothetical protein
MNLTSQPTAHRKPPGYAHGPLAVGARDRRMKKPFIPTACWKPKQDRMLLRVLRLCGIYYHSGDFFYQELWRDRLRSIGFRIVYVEKCFIHHVWDIRLCCTLTAQAYLLVSKPVAQRSWSEKDVLVKQLLSEIKLIAKDLGAPIKSDCLSVGRNGAYFRACFIWPLGKPGRLLKKDKKPDAFGFLIRPWLKKNRN